MMLMVIFAARQHSLSGQQVAASGSDPRTWIVDDDGLADFHTIQEAIDAASSGDTIFVKNGTYHENIVIVKTISLIGESEDNTLVDGTGVVNTYVMSIQANDTVISGFTIHGPEPMAAGYWGISLNGNNCTISKNIIRNLHYGITLDRMTHNLLESNTIGPCGHAVYLQSSSNNEIRDNVITSSSGGIYLNQFNHNNLIENNTLLDDYWGIIVQDSWANMLRKNNITRSDYGVFDSYSFDSVPPPRQPANTFYHNNFQENIQQVLISYIPMDSWDAGYPFGGNYWSDYNGPDSYSGPYQNETGFDWIGDSSHIIDYNNTDRYPLMTPFSSDIEEPRVVYRNLLLRFTETRSQLEATNSTLVGLVDSARETVVSMASEIYSLDTTVAYLQQQIIALNTTVNSTQSELQAKVSTLNTLVLELQGRLDSLNSTLQSSTNTEQNSYNSLSTQLSNILSATYALVATTVVLVIALAYLIVRRPKPKQLSDSE